MKFIRQKTERVHWQWNYFHSFALWWLLSCMNGCNGFTISDITTFRTAATTLASRPTPSQFRRSEVYYSNSNDPMSYFVNDTVLSNARTTTIPTPTPSHTLPARLGTATTITTLDDFSQVVQECRQSNTILMVHWSAPWCRSCQRIAPLLHRTVQQLSKKSFNSTRTTTPIRFVNIPLLYSLSTLSHLPKDRTTEHKSAPVQRTNLHAMFEIRTVPYCHIYHPSDGLVHECAITPNTNTSMASDNATQPHPRRVPKLQSPTSSKTVSELHQLLESYIQPNHALH